ncbi:MAG: UpxY family transcription antiterminator [Acidobacteriia bacterium]|nr:UpxY family transcription antiterminator [Terriglobia bacterium]
MPELFLPWFVLSLKPRSEKATAAGLDRHGIDHYLPLYHDRRRWSDRVKRIQAPLFPGYIFCRFSYSQRLQVLNLPSVHNIVGAGKTPIPVPDSELSAVRTMIESGRPVLPWPYLRKGQPVRIDDGPLAGLTGTLARDAATWRIVVNVSLLQRSVAVQLDRDCISPCSNFSPLSTPVHDRLQA